ncbi:SMP-30/gluconolactonase/LRE family protein [Variovorax sp. Sphag1AA]|uniref:SMP-30/gluconolactonase/LRE family protein n=1 Tax=Variovorax sp. Sphag1AA TaxID=2587027 RepID=UPI00161C7AF6|nr:SMP-30/gluconolactonase/LRE family protein [Variovorax sp. Sphag1AA]MBB3178382.1 sugar lactone lactonase YvrE [Variovorax sp. Sphag1AA]
MNTPLANVRPARVGTQRDILGESPLWDGRANCLWWVDIRQPAIRRLDPANGALQSWPMPALVGSIALTEDDRLLVALPQQIALFDPHTGRLEAFVEPPPMPPDHRFNDGRCDRQGRFWVGSMHNITRAPEGVLYCLEGTELRPVREGVCIPNSLAFSPDGRTMFFADSLRYELYAYDYDIARGAMGPERVIATTVPPGFPDGSTVDAEGFLWNAEFNAARLVRYAPDGRVDRIVPVPVPRPTCCAFGGPDLDVLYVTTASQNMTPEELEAQPLAGALLAYDVGVRGLPEPRFSISGPRNNNR